MIQESKKLFFKTASIAFDDELALKLAAQKKYSALTILTYQKFDLSDFEVTPKKTPVIYLDKEPREILLDFNSSTRNQINRTFNEPDFKFIVGKECFEDAYKLYKDFEYGQDRVPFDRGEMAHFLPFLAYFKNQPISLVFCLDEFPYLRARSICSVRLKTNDKKFYRWIACASRRLIYEACSYGRQRNYQWMDLGSINLDSADKSGIAEFKSSFHGELINEYTYFRKSPLFKILEKFVKIKLVIWKMFKI
ncbi:hypothetical protein KJ853_03315 [Patescibacteria group bacterium]|nr:hypothetical protein [Patescibacteria group bacterium]